MVSLTVTLQLELKFDPSVVVAVILASPALTAVTTPSLLTEATLLFEELQTTAELSTLSGVIMAASLVVAPTPREISVLSTSMDVAYTGVCSTITTHIWERLEPSRVEAVIIAEPARTALTTPFSTVATLLSLVIHATDLLVAFNGIIVAVKRRLSPSVKETFVLSRLILVACVYGPTLTLDFFIAPLPSVEATVIVASPILRQTIFPVVAFTLHTDGSELVHDNV